MSIQKAWSSEDGTVIAYQIESGGLRYCVVNDAGTCSSIYGEGIDLERKTEEHFERFSVQNRPVFEVDLHVPGTELTIASSHGQGRVFIVRAQGVLMNTGLNPHGIDQMLIATHIVDIVGGRPIGTKHLEEQQPLLLRNGATLIGLVQGWKATAEIQDLFTGL